MSKVWRPDEGPTALDVVTAIAYVVGMGVALLLLVAAAAMLMAMVSEL